MLAINYHYCAVTFLCNSCPLGALLYRYVRLSISSPIEQTLQVFISFPCIKLSLKWKINKTKFHLFLNSQNFFTELEYCKQLDRTLQLQHYLDEKVKKLYRGHIYMLLDGFVYV